MALQANHSPPPESGGETQDVRTVARLVCPMCKTVGKPVHRDLVDVEGGAPGQWSFSRCSDPMCGMLWLDPAPGRADGGRWRGADSAAVSYLRAESGGRLLDVRCGDGAAIDRARQLGWDAEGVEPDLALAEAARARGLRVAHGTLAGQGYPDDHFQAVVLSHVIERIHEPRAEVEECYRVLAPGGRLVVETPNAGAWCHQLMGANWWGLDPPRHLQVFTLGALGRLGRGCGLQIERLISTARGATALWGASMARRRGRAVGERSGGVLVALGAASEVALLALVPDVGEELVMVGRKPALAREKLVEREGEVRGAPMLASESAG